MKILCLGETLLRYSTKKGHKLSELDFVVHIGGSETNIATSMALFGFDTKLITKLPNHDLGDSVLSFLKSFGVDTRDILRCDKRMGSYFLEIGSGNRTSKVIYDRENSAMTSFSLEDINIEKIFEGIDVFVVSGITVALNKSVENAVLGMMKYCRDNNISIVYDSNYRAKMWSVEEAAIAFKKILPYVDILSAGYLDAVNFLGLNSDKEDFEEKLSDLYSQIKEIYPNLKYITCTKRKIISSTVNKLKGYLYVDKLYTSKEYYVDDIIDRVGGGDAYLSGILYGILNKKDIDYILNFGCCSSVLKHTISGDVNRFTIEEIDNYMNQGVERIQR